MHGSGKGKEGTDIKGRQGRTHFECSKSKKKSSKIKSSRRGFLRNGGVLGRMEGTVVFTEARRKQRCVRNSKTIFFSKMSTQARSKKRNGSIKAE